METTAQHVLLVTGASRGIGAATSLLAARAGYAVAVNYCSDQQAAEAVVGQIHALGGNAVAIRAQPGATVDPIIAEFGTLNTDGLSLVEIAANRKAASQLVDQVGFDN